MRIVVFGLVLLLAGIASNIPVARADCMAMSWTSFHVKNWYNTSRPVLWFTFNYYEPTDVPIFRNGRPFIFCRNDTIPLLVIDSIINKRNQQWLLRPVRSMQKDSIYRVFSKDTITWNSSLHFQYNLHAVSDWGLYTVSEENDSEPPRLTGEVKISYMEHSANTNCGGYTGVMLLIPRSDESTWIIKGIFTDTESGKQVTGYGVCDDAVVSFGRTSCNEELVLDDEKKYTLQLVLIDMDNNRTTVDVREVIDFYPEKQFLTNVLWTVGSVLLLILTAIWLLLKKQRRKIS